MRRGNLAVLTFLAFGVAVTSVACGSSEQSGACNGDEDGTYFQFQSFNFITEAPLEVRVNGRFVGNVPIATTNPSTGDIIPGEALLGEFPICSAIVVDARGTGIESTRACTTSVLTSPACRAQRADYCWASLIVENPGDNFSPTLKSPQCEDTTLVPDNCAGAFIQC